MQLINNFMTKTMILFALLLTVNKSMGQSPVLSLRDSFRGQIPGAYYKDTEGDFNKFVGVWKYQKGLKSLTIVFEKKTNYFNDNDNTYIDMLIGEYKYTDESGQETVNTLQNLSMTNLKPFQNNIAGTNILNYYQPVANRKVRLAFTDPERDYLNYWIVVKHISGTQMGSNSSLERIEIEFEGHLSIVPADDSPLDLRVPERKYILYKQ
jgi:hypothetical protein